MPTAAISKKLIYAELALSRRSGHQAVLEDPLRMRASPHKHTVARHLHDALIYRRQEPVREAGREKRPVWRLEPRRIQGYGPIGGRAPSWEVLLDHPVADFADFERLGRRGHRPGSTTQDPS